MGRIAPRLIFREPATTQLGISKAFDDLAIDINHINFTADLDRSAFGINKNRWLIHDLVEVVAQNLAA